MWGPADEVAILGLPARAAAGPRRDVPPGPDAARFTDADALAELIGGNRHRARATLHIDALDELWDGVRGGTVRTAARLAAASLRNNRRRTRAARRLAEPYRTAEGLRPPDDDPHRAT